jgi:hypothetical protein
MLRAAAAPGKKLGEFLDSASEESRYATQMLHCVGGYARSDGAERLYQTA